MVLFYGIIFFSCFGVFLGNLVTENKNVNEELDLITEPFLNLSNINEKQFNNLNSEIDSIERIILNEDTTKHKEKWNTTTNQNLSDRDLGEEIQGNLTNIENSNNSYVEFESPKQQFQYGAKENFEINEAIHHYENSQDNEHPLITLMDIQPHSMKIQIKPKEFQTKLMIRLLYERVPRNKPPHMRHLDDPVIEYIPIYKPSQEYGLDNLPMGKYIVCAEAQIDGQVIQTNCFETLVDRLDNNMLQSGVIAVIAIAIAVVVSAILYAVYFKISHLRKTKKDRLNNDSAKSPNATNVMMSKE